MAVAGLVLISNTISLPELTTLDAFEVAALRPLFSRMRGVNSGGGIIVTAGANPLELLDPVPPPTLGYCVGGGRWRTGGGSAGSGGCSEGGSGGGGGGGGGGSLLR